ncbi:MAG TPA: sensor histidine kinase [Pseudolabrys sp.]|nr:sensor histidine kinase [Pseudolabrys sp.]
MLGCSNDKRFEKVPDLKLRRAYSAIAFVCCLMPLLACLPAQAREAKQVMLLYSFGKDFKPWSAYATSIRAELARQSPWPLDITEHSLVTARSGDENPEGPFVEYLRAIFTRQPLDLIVAIGAPAAAFVQRHREQLFAGTPMVLMAVDQRRVQYSSLTAKDAVVAVRINYLAAVENILQVLPQTKDVMVVVGTSPIEKFWKEAIGKELEPLAGRINLSWTNHLSFDALLKRAAALPPNSAIFWELMIVDAAGIVHEGGAALAQLHAVTNAPIFSYDESFFGREIVGGPLLLVEDSSRQAAAVAVRILNGEKPNQIDSPPVQFASPVFDWREMQRWGIAENRLPPGSRIYFRSPTLWSQYRWQLMLIAAVILTEALLIAGLLYERRRRRLAEVVSSRRMAELAHLNRVATAGELSASIAHEVRQPLAAMVAQSSAAQRWLGQRSPNLDEAQAALKKIIVAGERASQIVENLRSMFRKESGAREPLDINAMVENVLALTSREAHRHGILVQTSFADGPKPRASGDLAQLEQVFLNLVMNAIEAMGASTKAPRILELTTAVGDGGEVLITVADTGPGVEGDGLEKMFDAFYTTKPQGMGMGLPICRSIVESHGGRLWASRRDRGLVFYVVLPGAGA